MNKIEKRWYIGLITLVLISLSFKIPDYINGAPVKYDDILTIITYIALLIYPYINNYSLKKRVEKMKKELNIQNDLTLDELLQIRLERDYHNKKTRSLRSKR